MRTVARHDRRSPGDGCSRFACAAAGPFDGKWIADIPAGYSPTCNYTSTLTLSSPTAPCRDSNHNPGNFRAVQGHVEADGTASFTVGTSPGTGKFTTDHFDITWFNGHCDRHAVGNRAPDARSAGRDGRGAQGHQAAYADLVRRAASRREDRLLRNCAPNMSMTRTGISMATRSTAGSARPMPRPRAGTAPAPWKRPTRY